MNTNRLKPVFIAMITLSNLFSHAQTPTDYDGVNKKYIETDTELNNVYNRLKSKLSKDKQKELRISELAWIKERSKRCYGGPDNFANKPIPLDALIRWTNENLKRIEALKEMMGQKEIDQDTTKTDLANNDFNIKKFKQLVSETQQSRLNSIFDKINLITMYWNKNANAYVMECLKRAMTGEEEDFNFIDNFFSEQAYNRYVAQVISFRRVAERFPPPYSRDEIRSILDVAFRDLYHWYKDNPKATRYIATTHDFKEAYNLDMLVNRYKKKD